MTSKRTWHKGPPPHVGWWNASIVRATKVWRWWDGEKWSAPTAEYENKEGAAISAARFAPSEELIEWSDYWPKNARVRRADPNDPEQWRRPIWVVNAKDKARWRELQRVNPSDARLWAEYRPAFMDSKEALA